MQNPRVPYGADERNQRTRRIGHELLLHGSLAVDVVDLRIEGQRTARI